MTNDHGMPMQLPAQNTNEHGLPDTYTHGLQTDRLSNYSAYQQTVSRNWQNLFGSFLARQ